jgi:DNA invertase Pin-like site-specific DNA recombinase
MRAAIYARVSTTDQTCDLQLRELRQYISARLRRIDVVVVWKLDRWGRSVAACIKSIQELASLGVRFIAVTQNIDTDDGNPMSRFLLHILAAFAELERELIRERVTAGVRAAKARGKQVGRPKRIFRRDEVVRLRAQGMSCRKIAEALGVPVATLINAHRTTDASS